MNETKTAVLSYENIIDYFLQHGCTMEESINIIKNCPELLNMSEAELDKKVSLLFNSDVLYGIIVCDKDNWKEYICSQTNDPNISNGGSYVAQSFIETVNKQYIQKILQILPTDTLEDKLYKMKKAAFNSSGYKVK